VEGGDPEGGVEGGDPEGGVEGGDPEGGVEGGDPDGVEGGVPVVAMNGSMIVLHASNPGNNVRRESLAIQRAARMAARVQDFQDAVSRIL